MSKNKTWSTSDSISISSPSSPSVSVTGNYSNIVASHVTIVVLAPASVVGNALVLTAIWKKSFQRTPFHILLSVLAFTDLCTGVASPIISVPFLQELRFGTVSVFGLLSLAYLMALTLIVVTRMSVERWLHMSRRSTVTSRRGWFTAIISLLMPAPVIVLQAILLLKKGCNTR